MPRKTAPFNFESAPEQRSLTAKPGGILLAELFHASGCAAAADAIGVRSSRGYSDADHVLSSVLLNALGFDAGDDLEQLRSDGALVSAVHLLNEHRGKERRTGNAFPSPSAFRAFLTDAGSTEERVRGFSGLSSVPVRCAQEMKPQEKITVDMDATIIPTERGDDVRCNYKGERSHMAFNSYVPELDMVVHSEFCPGNVSPRDDQLGLLRRTLSKLPEGVKEVETRIDSAGYCMDLIKYCCGGESPYGVIRFSISVPMYKTYREEIERLSEKAWSPFVDENGREETDRRWAEVNIVPTSLVSSEPYPEIRFIAVRERMKHPKLKERMDAAQMELAIEEIEGEHPKTERLHLTCMDGTVWKVFLMVTNDFERNGQHALEHHWKRCGKSEEVHGILKNDLAGGHVPSADFGSCAVWWYLCVLSYNLQRLMTHSLFPEEWARVHQKRLLATIYSTPAKMVRHGKQRVIRVFGLLGRLIEAAHWKVLRLGRLNI